jgi:DNA-binding transcriptional LysR family regulator
LRVTFGEPLFLRYGRRMLPTPIARDPAAPIVRALEAAREALRPRRIVDPAGRRRKFHRACRGDAMVTILPARLRRLRVHDAAKNLLAWRDLRVDFGVHPL